MKLEDHLRMMHICFGVLAAAKAVEAAGLPLADAQISLRTAAFMLEELFNSKPKSEEEMQALAAKLKPHVMEFIRSEMGVNEK